MDVNEAKHPFLESVITYDDLKYCHVLMREAEDIRERLKRMRSMLECVTAPLHESAGGSGGASGGDRIGDDIASFIDMEREGLRRIEAYYDHAAQVSKAIDRLTDSAQRTVLRLRYLDGLTWCEIGGKTHYHERTCRSLHNAALENMGIDKRHPTITALDVI